MRRVLVDNNAMMSKSRLDTLSDTIFAFAMTLLVISLTDVPVFPQVDAPVLLPVFLSKKFFEFVIFTIAFFILAGFWLAHHRIFHSIEYVDNRLIWVNMALLFFIVMIPFSTSMSGDYVNILQAVLFFHINLLCASALIILIWLYIMRHHGDLKREKEPERVFDERAQGVKFRALVIPGVIVLAIAVSFVDPATSIWCYILIPVIMLIAGWVGPRMRKTA
jgi:uncharacterized membrane protein